MKIKLLIAFFAICGIATAQWQQAGLSGKSIYSFASDGTNIFAGAFSSGAFLSTNSGGNWTPVNTGLPSQIATFDCYISSFAISGSNVFLGTAGTNGAGVFISTNAGSNWTPVNNGLTNLKVISLATSGANIFAGTNGGGVFVSANNGTQWGAANTGLTANTNAFAVSGSNIFAGTNGGGVFVSANNGTNWTPVNTGLTNLMVTSLTTNGTSIFAGTNGGGVFLSTNNGDSWTAVNSGLPASATVYSLGVSGTFIFAGIKNSGVFVSTNNGTNWTASNTGLPDLKLNTLLVTGATMFVGIDGGGVWKRPVAEIVSGVNEIDADHSITIFPNPFSKETTLSAGRNLKNATLNIYNAFGQMVKQLDNLSGEAIILHREHLPNGLYIVCLTEGNNPLTTGKLILTD